MESTPVEKYEKILKEREREFDETISLSTGYSQEQIEIKKLEMNCEPHIQSKNFI